MVLKLFNELVAAEGEPVELAMYTHALLEIFKMKHDMDQQAKDQEIISRFGDFSIFDLIKRELNEEQKDENDGGEHNDGT